MRPTIILVGGFLGAGKTTLIARAAGILAKRGVRTAVITNDQDNGLVDTGFISSRAIPTEEVAGGCFCCRFGDLMDAADRLRRHNPEVIFGEPVGSCVDLSATILQPLKAYYRAEYLLAPLTVLVDPAMARRVAGGDAGEHIAYLFAQQIAEADLLCVTKTDRGGAMPELAAPADFALSAATGHGVEEWLDALRGGSRAPGEKLLTVDYQVYAEAEAALGWVNLQADALLTQAAPPASVAGPLAEEIEAGLSRAGVRIAHVKVSVRCEEGFVKVSICGNGEEPQPDGDLAASPAREHEIVINLRALGDPEQLLSIARQALSRIDGHITERHAGAFRPAPPVPAHRFRERAV